VFCQSSGIPADNLLSEAVEKFQIESFEYFKKEKRENTLRCN
jgi:hypothetical protein